MWKSPFSYNILANVRKSKCFSNMKRKEKKHDPTDYKRRY